MSGAEAIAVLGVISSTIAIIDASKNYYDAVKDAKGLHEAFRKVAENIPLVLNVLRNAKQIQLRAVTEYESATDPAQKKTLEQAAEAVKPIMTTCQENAQKLHDIFEKVLPGDDASRMERYLKAVQSIGPGKKRKVEELMKEILEKLQLLHTNQFFRLAVQSTEVDMAIQQLDKIPSSLPEEDSRYSHSGSGSLNVNAGSGTQRNFTQSGGSGRMFNAEVQHFGNVGS